MMSTPVMFVLSALLIATVTCSGDEKAAANYNDGDMDGKWYIVAGATHGWSAFNRTSMTTVEVTSTPTELNAIFSAPYSTSTRGWSISISITFHFRRRRATCRSTRQVFIKDQTTAGVFTYRKQTRNYEVVVKQYEPTLDFAVIRTSVGDQFINELYSRSPTVSSAVVSMFLADALKDGNIRGDTVTFVDNTVKC